MKKKKVLKFLLIHLMATTSTIIFHKSREYAPSNNNLKGPNIIKDHAQFYQKKKQSFNVPISPQKA